MYNKKVKCDRAVCTLTVICLLFGVTLAASLEDTQSYCSVTSGVPSYMAVKQAICALLGITAMIIAGSVNTDKLLRLWKPIGAVGIVITLLTFTPLGASVPGTDDRAWLDLGVITVQPSEILKLCFIVTFSVHLDRVREKINSPLILLGLLAHGAVPIVIVYFQGDQGTAVIFGIMTVIMLFSAGLSLWYALGAAILSPAVVWFTWERLLLDHQKNRIKVLFDPSLDPLGTGYQQLQSRAALQSGGLLGKGLFSGGTEDFVYVSEAQNDFIFSYIGQTLGFAGCAASVLLLAGLCLRLVRCCGKCSGAESHICAGAFALIFSHTLINIGMVLGLLPVIGVPLPFFSSGGTAMLSMCAAVGLSRKNSDLCAQVKS